MSTVRAALRPLRPSLERVIAYGNWLRAPNHRLERAYVRRFGSTVRRGPFTGLELPPAVHPSVEVLVSKLLGAYEEELHGHVEALLAGPFTKLVNVGAGEGYYAVGMARRRPDWEVQAYEASPASQRLLERVAQANGAAGRLHVHGAAQPGGYLGADGASTLVVMDCEGAERVLLDPETSPGLLEATVLVELHDLYVPGTRDELLRRFAPTHDAEVLQTRERSYGDFPELAELATEAGLGGADLALAVTEYRPVPMEWALFTPRR